MRSLLTPRPTRRRRRAAQLLEFALTLPFFLLLIVLVTDMGRMVIAQSALHDAAYVAARAGAQVGGANVSNSQTSLEALNGAIAASPVLDPVEVRTRTATPSTCTNTDRFVTVSVAYDFDFLTPGLYQALQLANASTWSLSATGVARCEVVR